jgi:hypothetical protein
VTIHSIQDIIRDLRAAGISILITDHQVRETLQITDRSYVIRGGQVLCHGTPAEVLRNPEARKYYFGEGMDLGPISPAPFAPAPPQPVPAPLNPALPQPMPAPLAPANTTQPRRIPTPRTGVRASVQDTGEFSIENF